MQPLRQLSHVNGKLARMWTRTGVLIVVVFAIGLIAL